MATSKKLAPKVPTDEVEVLDVKAKDEVEEIVEEVTPEEEIKFTPTTKSKPIEKNVKVRFARNYKGCIGGVWYYFKKDEVAVVPENVKSILTKAEGILKPL